MFCAFEDFQPPWLLSVGVEFSGLLYGYVVIKFAMDDEHGGIQLAYGVAEVIPPTIFEVFPGEPLA